MLYSDPMPGENFENAAEREKAKAEQEAIARGESFNPYSDDGFNSLESEVPFAGNESADDGKPELGAGESIDAGKQEDDLDSSSEQTVVGKTISADFDAGVTSNLENVKESVDANYIDGATEEIFNDPAALGATNETIKNPGANDENAPNDDSAEQSNQPKNSAVAASELAIGVSSQAEDLADKLKAGDANAMMASNDFEEKLATAQQAIDSIDSAVSANGEGKEAEMARDLKAQAQEMKDEAEAQFNEAKSSFESMTDEEKEDAQEAQEKAEENGTSFDEELQKLEETRKKLEEEEKNMHENVQNDIAAGIFG